jgi:hypothetical protein
MGLGMAGNVVAFMTGSMPIRRGIRYPLTLCLALVP